MALETIQKLKNAETQAVSIEEVARIKAEDIIKKAQNQSKELIEQCVSVSESNAQKQKEQSEKAVAQSMEKAKEQSKIEVESLNVEAMKKQNEVTKKIAELII